MLFAVKKGTAPALSMWQLEAVWDSQWQGWEGCRDPSLPAALRVRSAGASTGTGAHVPIMSSASAGTEELKRCLELERWC